MLDKTIRFLQHCLRRPYVLRIETLRRGCLPDADDLLLHASFQCLVDFVETEASLVCWHETTAMETIWLEIMSLYRWWRHERPARWDPVLNPSLKTPADLRVFFAKDKEQMTPEELAFHQALDESAQRVEEWQKEDEEMLLRLVQVRAHLWV